MKQIYLHMKECVTECANLGENEKTSQTRFVLNSVCGWDNLQLLILLHDLPSVGTRDRDMSPHNTEYVMLGIEVRASCIH